MKLPFLCLVSHKNGRNVISEGMNTLCFFSFQNTHNFYFYFYFFTQNTGAPRPPRAHRRYSFQSHLFRKTINCVTGTAYVTLNAFLFNLM